MIMRYRWFKAEWPISIRELAERFKSNIFSEFVSEGFVIDRVRDDFLEARFIERINIVEKSVDPFGNDLTYERIEYKQTSFRAWSGQPGLELINAPRGVNNLFTLLSEINDFKIVLAPLKIDVLKWVENFQGKVEKTAIMDSLQIGGLTLEDGVTAKVIVKGDIDVRNSSKKLTQGKKFILQKVQLLIPGNSPSHITFTNDGAAKIEVSSPDETILTAIRASIQCAL